MKCPDCQFVCSDLRDVCPRCLVDLRPYKKALGIKISNPSASHQELIGKTAERSSNPHHLWSGIKSFVKVLLPAKDSSKDSRAVHEQAPEPETTPPAMRTAAIEQIQAPQRLEIETRFVKAPELFSGADAPQKPPTCESLFFAVNGKSGNETTNGWKKLETTTPQRADLASEEPRSESSTLEPAISEVPATSSTTGSTENFNQLPEQGLIPNPAAQPAKTTLYNASDHTADKPAETGTGEKSEPEPNVLSNNLEPADEFEAVSTEQLFEAAYRELKTEDSQIELENEQLTTFSRSEEATLLFDLTRESIANPKHHKYVENITPSESRQIATPTLQKELARIEQVVNAPQITLKGFKTAQTAGTEKGAVKTAPRTPLLEPAPWQKRLAAFILDGFSIAALAGFVAAGGLFFQFQNWRDFVIDPLSLDAFDGIYFLEMFIIAFLALLVIYPLISMLILKTCPWAGALGLTIACPRQARLPFENVLIRALTFPLSALFFGYLPLLRGRNAWHDAWSGTSIYFKRP